MKHIKLPILLILLIAANLSGCSSKSEDTSNNYSKISATEANNMMKEDDSVIVLDVRTAQEYKEGHIEGALLLPNTEIASKASEILADKSATILVYCRSGNRSASAAQDLVDAGYTNVYDFGGIIDWEYDIVTE